MEIREKTIEGFFEIIPSPIEDDRGYMARWFDDKIFEQAGLNNEWVQESCSYTKKKNIIRGLHVSLPPALEGKTITALTGNVLWVVVDVRKNSTTFGQWESTVLSGETHNTICAGRGFAHGCVSLTDNCSLLLRADTYFSDTHGTGIVWNDKELAIDWELNAVEPIICKRDKKNPSFSEFRAKYGGV